MRTQGSSRRIGAMTAVAAMCVAWCLAIPAAGQTTATSKPATVTLVKGDRLAIVGDSITEQKQYSRFMEDYLTACTPQLDIWTIQLGWGGETAQGFLGRMDMDLLSFKPTIVTTCYGMNDGRYTAFTSTIGLQYEQPMRAIIQKTKAAGARMVVGTPGAVDSKSWRGACGPVVYNQNLAKLGEIDLKLASELGVGFADVHEPLMTVMAAAKEKLGDTYNVCGGDGVHPDGNGHIVMAYAFLKGLGLDGQIGTITIDMAGKATASDGHKVVSSDAGTAQIESTRYPFCFYGTDKDEKNPSATKSILPFTPFNQDLNRLTLIVKNLKADKANVTWGDASKSFTKDELAKGINLAAEFLDNPFCEPFKKVDAAVGNKQNFETGMIKGSYHNLANLQKDLGDDAQTATAVKTLIEKLNAKQQALAKAAREAVVPVTHKITVTAE